MIKQRSESIYKSIELCDMYSLGTVYNIFCVFCLQNIINCPREIIVVRLVAYSSYVRIHNDRNILIKQLTKKTKKQTKQQTIKNIFVIFH